MTVITSHTYSRRSRSPRHNRKLTRSQRRDLLILSRVLLVGVGCFLTIAGAGPDPAVTLNLPLSIAGVVLAMGASLGLSEPDAGRR